MKKFTGSIDTERKLERLKTYLQTYSIALKDQGFARIYIDAFAGTGQRTEVRSALPLFGADFAEQVEVNTPGSARIALSIEPPFDTIALIEQDKERFAELEGLRDEFPAQKIVLKHGDANHNVRLICSRVPWHQRQGDILGMRGVIFLDPFGMEVEWATVEAVAATRALDCWYFFPLSGLYRNAPHDITRLDASKQAAIDRVLGTADWRTAWYDHPIEQTLFESEASATQRADVDAIEQFVMERLKTVFKGLVMPPVRLRHNNKAPMASLFFAVSNTSEKAVSLARRISDYILRPGISS